MTTQSTGDKIESQEQGSLYADLHHSTNPPAPPLPAELVPVQYATVKKQTGNTVTTQSDHEDKAIGSQEQGSQVT